MQITEGMKAQLHELKRQMAKESFSKGMRNRFYLKSEFKEIRDTYYSAKAMAALYEFIAKRTINNKYTYDPINERMQVLKSINLIELVDTVVFTLGTQKIVKDTNYFYFVSVIGVIAGQIRNQLNQINYVPDDENIYYHLAGDVISAFDGSIIVIFKEKEKKQWAIRRVKKLIEINKVYESLIENTLFQIPKRKAVPHKVVNNFMNGQPTGSSLLVGKSFVKHPHALNYKAINYLDRIPLQIDRVAFGQWGINKDYELPEGIDAKYKKRLFKETTKTFDNLLAIKFYNAYGYDSRGRIYVLEHVANHQQHESSRCMLNIADNAQVLSKKGVYFLKTSIISYLEPMLDDGTHVAKLHPDLRVKWFDEVTTDTSGTFIGTDELHALLPSADKPKMAFRAITWFEEYMDNPSSPIDALGEVDASASGLQILSVASKDVNGMKVTNVIKNDDADQYNDPYKVIYDETMKKVKSVKSIKRKDLKMSIMITFYGGALLPKKIFGEDYGVFMSTLGTMFPRVIKAFKYIENLTANSEGHFMYWMPDGHLVKIPATGVEDLRVSMAWLNSSTRMRLAKLLPGESVVGLIANITHSIDAYVMRTVLLRCKEAGIKALPLHDAWLAHPNHLATIQKYYVDALQSVMDYSVLYGILTQLQNKNISTSKPFEFFKRSESDIKIDSYLGLT